MSAQGTAFHDLVRQAVDGSSEAAGEILRRYAPAVRAAVRRRVRPGLRPRFDTDDVVQSTMAVALQDLPDLNTRSERAFLAWLLRIADRRLKMAVRRHRAARRDVRREGPGDSVVHEQMALPTASEVVGGADERRRVREAVALLEGLDRKVVELRGYRGLSYEEVAQILDLTSAEAARQRFLRALPRLRTSLRSML